MVILNYATGSAHWPPVFSPLRLSHLLLRSRAAGRPLLPFARQCAIARSILARRGKGGEGKKQTKVRTVEAQAHIETESEQSQGHSSRIERTIKRARRQGTINILTRALE